MMIKEWTSLVHYSKTKVRKNRGPITNLQRLWTAMSKTLKRLKRLKRAKTLKPLKITKTLKRAKTLKPLFKNY